MPVKRHLILQDLGIVRIFFYNIELHGIIPAYLPHYTFFQGRSNNATIFMLY